MEAEEVERAEEGPFINMGHCIITNIESFNLFYDTVIEYGNVHNAF